MYNYDVAQKILFCFRSFSNGPCTLMMIIILLISNIILVMKKPKSTNEPCGFPEYRRNLLMIIPVVIAGLSLMVIAVYFVSSEEFGLFLLFSFFLAMIQNCVIIFYIVKTPKLKFYVYQTYQNSKTKVLCNEIYFILETIYDCFVFLILCGQTIQHFQHQSSQRSNQVQPI